jgi:hypothetical protein
MENGCPLMVVRLKMENGKWKMVDGCPLLVCSDELFNIGTLIKSSSNFQINKSSNQSLVHYLH